MEECRVKFRSLLKEKAELTEPQINDLEIGIYNWAIKFSDNNKIVKNWKNNKFVNVYMGKCRSILVNVDKNSYLGNMRLVDRLNDGEFLPHDIATMTADNIYPEKWRTIIDTKLKKEESIFEERPEAMTNQFKCGRCKKSECVYKELQIRSCDEPMTLFITCLNCGNRWRI